MTAFRNTLRVLAVIQVILAGLTAFAGAFADGGDIWSRLLVSVVHPICAIAILVIALRPRTSRPTLFAVLAIIVVAVIADLTYSRF